MYDHKLVDKLVKVGLVPSAVDNLPPNLGWTPNKSSLPTLNPARTAGLDDQFTLLHSMLGGLAHQRKRPGPPAKLESCLRSTGHKSA